jgi:hypothetical protein
MHGHMKLKLLELSNQREGNQEGMQHARERSEMHKILCLEKLKRKNFLKEPEKNWSIYWY